MSAVRRNSRIAGTPPSIQRASVECIARVFADKAGCSGDPVGDDIRSEPAGLGDGLRAALERRRQPALRVRQRHDDVLGRPAALDDLAVLRQLVLAERDGELRHRHGDHGDSGHRLRRARERLEIEAGHGAVEPERLLAGADRRGVVLAWKPWRHGCILSGDTLSAVTATVIDGKALAAKVRAEVATDVAELGHVGLATILVGEDPASEIYIRGKHKAAREAGFESFDHHLPAETTEEALLALIAEINADDAVDGLLVQLPVPDHLDENTVIEAISPAKDIDGLHPMNAGRLALGRPGLVPGTPMGIMRMLEEYEIETKGAEAVVVGRSNIVGKPMAQLLLRAHATVTICHSRTRDLAGHTLGPTSSWPRSESST